MRDVLALAQPPLRRFLPGLLLGILSSASAVALLATSAWLITKAAEQPPILFLSFAIVGVRAFALGRAFFRYVERLASHDAAFRGLATLRVGIYRRLLPLAPDGLRDTRRGDLLSRLVGDVDRLQDLPLRVVQPLATSIVIGVLSVIGVAIALPAAGGVLAVALVVAVVTGTLVQRRLASSADRDLAPLGAALADRVIEHLDRLDVLTAFGRVDESARAIERADAALRAAQMAQARGRGAVMALNSLIAGAATLVSVLVAAPSVLDGSMSGPLLAVVALVPIAVFEVFGMVPLALGAWREVSVSAHRVADVVPAEIPAEIPVAPAAPVAIEPGVLVLDNVSARWPEGTRAVRNISLTVSPGDCVLVTGESGAGKTSLAHVLVRFLDYAGSYTIGGIEASVADPDAVRRIVGLCEQSPHIFDDTIRQNLNFARETATDDELLAVLASVGLDDWVAERGGLDARVGERGALVSGGQAQRIALARALLAEFPILVLDEPTANVDGDRADALMADLLHGAAAQDRAVILISHVPVAAELVTQRLTLTR